MCIRDRHYANKCPKSTKNDERDRSKGKGKGSYSGGKSGANVHELNPWAVSLGSLEYYGSSLNLIDVCDSDSGIFNWELLDASETIEEDIFYEKVDDDEEAATEISPFFVIFFEKKKRKRKQVFEFHFLSEL